MKPERPLPLREAALFVRLFHPGLVRRGLPFPSHRACPFSPGYSAAISGLMTTTAAAPSGNYCLAG